VHCLVELAAELESEPPGRDVWLIPALNIDGLAAGSKNNANDVDLNRSFAASSWRADHRPGYFPGRAPESEPEAQALVRLIADSRAQRLVSLHQPFHLINYDGAGRALAQEMAERNGYAVSAEIGYPTPGSFGGKYGIDLGLEVVTLEIPMISDEEAWSQNRLALRWAVGLGS
jgi:protein MpaA